MKDFTHSARPFELAPYKELPDGTVARVYPYHLCFEGKEDAVLFRDGEDCDVMVKIIANYADKCVLIPAQYIVVSNHSHIILLAENEENVILFANLIKKGYSLWAHKKYGDIKLMSRLEFNVLLLDTVWYLRNALAYVTRNAFDNSNSTDSYRWCAHRAFFKPPFPADKSRKLSELSVREARKVLHCRDYPKHAKWVLNADDELEPYSFCDVSYVEAAFNHDPVFYMRMIGQVNASEMKIKLMELPKGMLYDAEFYKIVSETSQRWFGLDINRLSLLQKARLIPYINRTIRTSVSQLARVFGMEKAKISEILQLPKK